jgi:hypothetical protein
MASHSIHIGDVIGHGILFDPRNAAVLPAMDFNDLLASIPRLFDLLDERGVGYVLVGGIAMRVHAPGRNTQDIDLIVPADALARVPEIRVVDRKGSFARGEFGHLQVGFLLGDHASSTVFAAVMPGGSGSSSGRSSVRPSRGCCC